MKDKILEHIKQLNSEFKVANLRDNTVDLLLKTIAENDVKTVLEIGTGVGYSSYKMAQFKPDLMVTSVEKDSQKYLKAKEVLSSFSNINLINIDCFEYETNEEFDLILIDGPKRNQVDLFNNLSRFSHQGTIYFIDNINLKKFRNASDITSNMQRIIDSIDDFKNFLLSNNDYKFQYIDIDDGIMIGKKSI